MSTKGLQFVYLYRKNFRKKVSDCERGMNSKSNEFRIEEPFRKISRFFTMERNLKVS